MTGLMSPVARNTALVLLASAALAACAGPRYATGVPGGGVSKPTRHAAKPSGEGGRYKVGAPYQVGGVWYVPQEDPGYDQTGIASWYGDAFHMKATANGELFDMNALSAAHTTLPLPSIVEVTNLDNGKKIEVRVNDRGPFVGGRIIDLSAAAARELGYDRKGLARVRVRYLRPAPLGAPGEGRRYAAATPAKPAPAASSYTAPPAYTTPVSAQPYAPPTYAAPAYTPPAAAPIEVASAPLPPLQAPPVNPTPAPPRTYAAAGPVAAGHGGYRVQAGAFSDPANAERAASRLASAGSATIEPVDRGGVTLYRVMLAGPADETAAWSLRDQVAAFGFAEARVVRPF